MDQLTELFKQMQELAGVGLDMLHGAQGKGGAPGHNPDQAGDAGRGPDADKAGDAGHGPNPDRAGDGGAPPQGAPKPPPFGR
jgi:hypothetical protein